MRPRPRPERSGRCVPVGVDSRTGRRRTRRVGREGRLFGHGESVRSSIRMRRLIRRPQSRDGERFASFPRPKTSRADQRVRRPGDAHRSRSCTSAATSAARSASARPRRTPPRHARGRRRRRGRRAHARRARRARSRRSRRRPPPRRARPGRARPPAPAPARRAPPSAALERWDRDASLDVDRGAGLDGLEGREARRRRAPPPAVRTRTSTRADASRGTVLTAVPAATSVGVTVVPSSGRASAATASNWCASSSAAFAPFSGIEARVRGRPRTSILYSETPLRSVFSAPAALGSSTSAASIPVAVSSIRAGRRRPDLLVGREQDRDAVESSRARRARRAAGRRPPSCRRRRAGRAPVPHLERPARERPDRPDGVEMTDEQHALVAPKRQRR